VLPEDLIYRFAEKLDFGEDTRKVAEGAIRLAQRMSLDWMVMGRRPSGVCGACIILSARMHNYRRTIKEVVYIVKVTSATIQKRLDEFKLTPSSQLTIKDFLNNEMLEQQFDPPSFYEKQPEFIANKKTKKRRRKGIVESEEEVDESENSPNKRQRTSEPPLRRDKDGFAIPAPPRNKETFLAEREVPDIVDDVVVNDETGTSSSLVKLVQTFNALVPELVRIPDEESSKWADTATENIEPWMNDEAVAAAEAGAEVQNYTMDESDDEDDNDKQALELSAMQDQPLTEEISDPTSEIHAIRYKDACKKTRILMKRLAETGIYTTSVSMDPIVREDEFVNDPDIESSILDPAHAAVKEKVWINANKEWLKRKQDKDYEKRLKENDPTRKKRNRKSKPKVGEGVAPAATLEEANQNLMEKRSFSKKLNYGKMNEDVFGSLSNISKFGSQAQGSPGTSRATSTAPSTILISDDSEEDSVRGSSIAPSARDDSVAPSVADSVAPSVAEEPEGDAEMEAEDDEVDEDERNDENNFMKQLIREREEGETQDDAAYSGDYDDYDEGDVDADVDVPAEDEYGGGYVSAEEFDD
jgi:transcription factor IIIB subunit 2